MIFGTHDIPLTLTGEGYELSVTGENKSYRYRRTVQDETVERIVLCDKGRVLLHPIAPLSLPKPLSQMLLIAFDTLLSVEPKTNKNVFLTFPVEIGVFLSARRQQDRIDTWSLVPPKFTLYGDPQRGVVCRYWKSGVSSVRPEPNPLMEGVLELKIDNKADRWLTLQQVVLSGYGMKIFFSPEAAAMGAVLTVESQSMATTHCVPPAGASGMSESPEILTAGVLSGASTRFIMEYGL